MILPCVSRQLDKHHRYDCLRLDLGQEEFVVSVKSRNLFSHEGPRLFEFAIYRLSPDKFYAEDLRRREGCLSRLDLTGDDLERYKQKSIAWNDAGWYEYNQVVGWARLALIGTSIDHGSATIKGYYSRRDRQRISRYCRAPFEGSYKFTEFNIYREDRSEEIIEKIRSQVLQLTRRGRFFAGRYVDFEIFDSLAPWINWHALLELDAEPQEVDDWFPLDVVGVDDDLPT
jgi:hypothetical protein